MLTDIHVFVLANILRRPIIIFGEGEASVGSVAQECDIFGIYLPLLWGFSPLNLDLIHKDPICLSFLYGHFCALVQKAPRHFLLESGMQNLTL